MNVIYGPNESGKSSWHAALYAALCGMKRAKGQPAREDRIFTSRHRPWRGTSWKVGAVLSLDDGRTVEIAHSLGSRGESTAVDQRTKKPLKDDLVRSGSIDATALLGLTREAALATVFVKQADILRVLADADALQEYLERAAATSSADTTADEALERIAEYRKARVGLMRSGSRGPLAVATKQLELAQNNRDLAEEAFENYQKMLFGRRAAEAELRDAEERVRQLRSHEGERRRQEQWETIRAAERKLDQAHQLIKRVGAEPRENERDGALIEAVKRALVVFEARPDIPTPLKGVSAAELSAQIQALPDHPNGDMEPDAEVLAAAERWRGALARLKAHDENEPRVADLPALPATPIELRQLAGELDTPVPQPDPTLADRIAQMKRALPEAPPPVAPAATTVSAEPVRAPINRKLLGASAALALIGAVLLLMGQLPAGALVFVVGAVGVFLSRGKAAASAIPVPVSSPLPAVVDQSELPRLEARLAVEEETSVRAQGRVDAAVAHASRLGLRPDADALRQLAAASEAAGAARERHDEWRVRREDLTRGAGDAGIALREAMESRGETVADVGDLEAGIARYVASCRERAEVEREAARQPGLEAQLVDRRAAEESRAKEVVARQAAEAELERVASTVGLSGDTHDETVEALQGWLLQQEELEAGRQQALQVSARLEQLLDGQSVEGLAAEVEALIQSGDEPYPEDVPRLPDRSGELEKLEGNSRRGLATLSELVGQIEAAESQLPDVSKAIEAEERAGAEVDRLNQLAENLDMASEILSAAQEKIHADIAPILNETIRPWVPRVTGGRYDDIRVDPATLELEAREVGGEFRSATVLSHGTTEQLFLLLRLALAQHLTTTDEKAPIILDDITVQSDAERTAAALDLLHELSAEHQVILFSQEEEVLRWAERRLSSNTDRLVRLESPT